MKFEMLYDKSRILGERRTGPLDIDHLLESTDPRAL
jgi:hypothetical protein